MIRTVMSKAMSVGRFASAVFGLALVLGLVFGVATMALGANGGNFILGQVNSATALSRLTGNVQGAAMQVINNNAGSDDTALNLQVQQGEAPMRVNSDAKVTNLNADKLDGLESTDLRVSCPSGTTFFGGAGCIETTIRPNASFVSASSTCAAAGRRLPTSAELDAFRQQPGVDIGDDPPLQGEWVGTRNINSGATLLNDAGNYIQTSPDSTSIAFRCVTAPSI